MGLRSGAIVRHERAGAGAKPQAFASLVAAPPALAVQVPSPKRVLPWWLGPCACLLWCRRGFCGTTLAEEEEDEEAIMATFAVRARPQASGATCVM